MIIHVTADHIHRGEPYDGERCPVALALADLGYIGVSVSLTPAGDGVSILLQGHVYTIPDSAPIAKRIFLFDTTYAMRPFAFEMSLPPP